jgi:signal transduction histidine kinase
MVSVMWLRAVRENRRAILAFVVWAVVSMMALSLSYGLGYLVHIPLRGLPSWLFITLVYGFVMAAGLIVANAALWAAVVVVRSYWRPSATPGLALRALACAAGGVLGYLGGELAKSAITGAPPELTPLGPAIVGGAWLGMLFFLLRLAVHYAARYRRVKLATRLARGQVLATQLKPHFLFNSLNSLSELIETDAQQGAEMAHRLSELFRRISGGAQHATMPLASELAIVREYLAIEKVRLGDRLTYEVEEPKLPSDVHVPTLMLQTLVENAIKHGIAPSIEGGRVRVSFREREDGLYECDVFNTGTPLKPRTSGEGTGLANTDDRLRQLYGDGCTLSLGSDGQGTRASFWFTGKALAQNLDR